MRALLAASAFIAGGAPDVARSDEPVVAADVPAATAKTEADPPPIAPNRKVPRAHRQEIPPSAFNPLTNQVRWNPEWPKFRTAEYVVTGLMGLTVFGALAIPPQPDAWREMGELDSGARDVLRLDSLSARNTARDASDVVLALMVNQLVVDATLVAWWGHDRPSVAYEMVLMDLEALAISGGIQAIVSGLTSRWRPYRETCVGPLETQTRDCNDNKQYRSFFSGHTSGAFTVAGLMCMHHAYLPLYGGGAREVLTCAASFAAAATVGALRVMSDQHFLSDALVGAAVGTLSGLGVPWLLHYRGGAKVDSSGRPRPEGQVSLRLVPMPMGVAASGEF